MLYELFYKMGYRKYRRRYLFGVSLLVISLGLVILYCNRIALGYPKGREYKRPVIFDEVLDYDSASLDEEEEIIKLLEEHSNRDDFDAVYRETVRLYDPQYLTKEESISAILGFSNNAVNVNGFFRSDYIELIEGHNQEAFNAYKHVRDKKAEGPICL